MSSARAFADATKAFLDHLADVKLLPLVGAIACHLGNLLLRTRAWLNILRAAYPAQRVRWRGVLGAYVAGVGINAFAPARGGDLVKLYAVRQRIRGATAPTLVASLVAETLFDLAVAIALIVFTYASGRLPQLPRIPESSAFEWSFIARHLEAVAFVVLASMILGVALVRYLAHHVRQFWARVGQGMAILRTPRRYLRLVAAYQALGWCLRVGVAYLLLDAFGASASVQNALVVLVVGAVATLLPFTPGGVGAQQALLVVALAGTASRGRLLAFSVGAQAVTMTVSVVAGVIALLAMFGTLRIGALRQRAGHAADPPGP